MRAWLVCIVLLAGCTAGNQLPTAFVSVSYPDGGSDQADHRVDLDARPTEHLYQQNGTGHPDFYSVHDLIYEISQGGIRFTTRFFSFGDASGFFVCSVSGQPALEDGECPADAGGFYEFRVGDEPAAVGISHTPVEGGMAYSFAWTSLG